MEGNVFQVVVHRIRNFVICVSSLRGFQCKMMRQTQKKRDKRDKIRDKWDKIKDNETKVRQSHLCHLFCLIHIFLFIMSPSNSYIQSDSATQINSSLSFILDNFFSNFTEWTYLQHLFCLLNFYHSLSLI